MPRGKDSRYPLDRRLGGPQSRSGHRGYRKNPFVSAGDRTLIAGLSSPQSDTILTELLGSSFENKAHDLSAWEYWNFILHGFVHSGSGVLHLLSVNYMGNSHTAVRRRKSLPANATSASHGSFLIPVNLSFTNYPSITSYITLSSWKSVSK
jgi:hypothetical protein